MDKEQAKRLIKKTFEAPFDKGNFVRFITNLLNFKSEDLERTQKGPWQGQLIPESFRDNISKYERLAKYSSGNDRIDILVVYLKKQNSIERARTMQRNFIAGYLKGNYGSDTLKDATLVAFVSPDKENWRFSLVKMDYRVEQGTSGKIKIKEELTPARRWSFLVGKNEKSYTAQSRLIPILEDEKHNPTLAQLEEAFNIEPVTKEFYEKYRNLLIRTVDALGEIVEKDQTIREEFESKNINTVDFAKKLLGQIVFLYFLQKKGWFGVQRDAKWGTGPKDFLRRLFNKEYDDYNNFFNDILEPLFYEALARERDDNFYSRFNCKIPFLNGGLFEPIDGYDWVHTDITLPDDLFSNTRKTPEGDIGDGILDIFDRFNFTVKEDEPLEKEVAIDPELLGKLYEKFNAIRPDNFYEYKKALTSGKKSLEKKFNKKFGVYYTPREIVHYMCQQSLIYYLSTELEGKVNKEDIETLIKFGEQFIENDTIALNKKQLIKAGEQKDTHYKFKLPDSIRIHAKLIDKKLKDIKVCDPAIGSGAFPVGMMHEIVKTRNVLSAFINEAGRNTYNFKREYIENSLYGVDIDAGAVEVAKLRLWLSLVVDEEDINQIKPLPNLDYKIVCGNSLLGIEKNLLNWELFKVLEKLKPLYFHETNPKKKQEYKKQIEELISKITKGRKEFDFEVYFSEVFHQKGGFDVVIANPPYVRQEKIKEQKKALQEAGYEVYNSTSDLYTYFFEKSWKILKPDGYSCFITSNKWMRAKYGEKLRKFFKQKTKVIDLIDFGGYPVFEATVDTNIILFKKRIPNKKHKVKFVNVESELDGKDLITFIEKNHGTILQENFDDKCWTLADEKILKLKEKIEKIGTPLKYWEVKIYRGILTGLNDAFIINEETRQEILNHCRTKEERERTKEIIKSILRGRDIRRYYYKWEELWVIATFPVLHLSIDDYPSLKRYLLSFGQERLEQSGKTLPDGRKSRKKTTNKWFETQDTTAYYREFKKEKIVFSRIVKSPQFAYDNKGFYTEATTYVLTGESIKYLTALLNSPIIYWFFYEFYSGGGVDGEIKIYKLEQLPLPKISNDQQKPFINLVNKILSLTQSEDYLENAQKHAKVQEYSNQIDQLVYKLYGLTEEEIKIVENAIKRK